MDMKICIFLFLTIFISQCLSKNYKAHYESVQKACEQCQCRTNKDENKVKHYILDCSVKNMKHIFAGWPVEFGENQTGTEIIASFSGNSIQTLYQLPETEAVVSFSCRHCGITEFESAVFVDVVNIKRVDLSWNNITGDELRVDIFRGRFSNREYDPIPLEELDLSHNTIHTLERKLFAHTPHLKKLNLAYNVIGLIDLTTMYALTSVQELTHLDLSYNKLTDLPLTLFHPMTHLQVFRISGNDLMAVPDCFNQLAGSLRSLSIGDNPIEKLTALNLINFTKLQFLNMSGMSELKEVAPGSFAKMASLEVLLSGNNPKLEMFDIESLKEATNLKQLDLSNCNLRKLNLDYDFEMPIDNRKKFWQNLHKIQLSGNPWNCDCFLAHTLAGMVLYNNATRYSEMKARCETPYELAGTLLDSLSIERECQLPSMNMQVIGDPPLETHQFLRPKAIVLTIVASVVVIAIAFVTGFGIVMIRRRLRQNTSIFTNPIRYTTVRNSTMSTMSSVVPE